MRTTTQSPFLSDTVTRSQANKLSVIGVFYRLCYVIALCNNMSKKGSDEEVLVEIDSEMLVEVIQRKPALYNHNLKDYHSKEIVDAQWEAVAKEMGVTGVECKTKWQNIRNGYSRHLRNEKELLTLGNAAKRRKKWYLAEKLTFLDEFMAQRRRPENTSFKYEPDESQSIPNIDADHMAETLPPQMFHTEADYWSQDTAPRKKPRRSQKLSEFLLEQIMDVLKSRVHQAREETESMDMTFFKSLIPDVEKLDDRRKRKFKEGVMRSLHSLLDEQEDEAS